LRRWRSFSPGVQRIAQVALPTFPLAASNVDACNLLLQHRDGFGRAQGSRRFVPRQRPGVLTEQGVKVADGLVQRGRAGVTKSERRLKVLEGLGIGVEGTGAAASLAIILRGLVLAACGKVMYGDATGQRKGLASATCAAPQCLSDTAVQES